jgi:hypothetical protein
MKSWLSGYVAEVRSTTNYAIGGVTSYPEVTGFGNAAGPYFTLIISSEENHALAAVDPDEGHSGDYQRGPVGQLRRL